MEVLQGLRRVNHTVIFSLCVFAFLYYVAAFCVIVPWFSYSVPGVTNLGVLTITSSISLYCYLFCVLLDPGRVPDGWAPDQESFTAVQEVKRKGGAPRFCQKCQNFKPPRTHHCRRCQKCVSRMDHHCPWTNNCIGHANYKAFLVFLVYVNAALIHTLGLIAAHTVHALHTSQQQRILRTGPQGKPVELSGIKSIWLWALLQFIAFAVALPLTIGLVMLLMWHIHLVITNKTTIEYQEGVTAIMKAMTTGEDHIHPYDLGLMQNLHEILGHNPLTWLCPPLLPTSGGTTYPTIWDQDVLGQKDSIPWQ